MGGNYKKIKSLIKKYWQEILVLTGAVIYFIYFSVASILKYYNYYTGRFDLGNMTQTVWNTAHGNLFMLTDPNGVDEVSRLAFHADFILVFFAPFYLFWEDPRTLLIIQSFVLSLGGVFVYLIAREVTKNRTLSLIFATCFFLNPAVNFTNLFDFHGVTLATTFLLAAFYFTITKKWGIMLLFLVLAGLTKEQVWAITFLFGLYVIFISKQKVLGLIISLLSISAFFILFWHAIPAAAGNHHFAVEFYSDFGDSPSEIIKNVISDPVNAFQTLTLPDRLDYVKKLFMPLGYLSVFAFPLLIFAAPDLFINLLSGSVQMHQIYYQYSATITPFIFIAAIYGARFLLKKFPQLPVPAFYILLLGLTLLAAFDYGPLPFARKPNNAWYKDPLANRVIVDNYLKSIPGDLRISASNNLGSHLSHRKNIYVIPNGFDRSDMVLFLVPNPTTKEREIFEEFRNNPGFNLVFSDGDFYVFKRTGP